MKSYSTTALILLSTTAIVAGAQAPRDDGKDAQRTQVVGYWVDPSTGLMWAAADNGRDISFKRAVKYCRNLRLAGFADWRLANMFELQPIYDKTANAPGLTRAHNDLKTTWHVKGNLFLTGYQWANNLSGRTSGYQYYFDFNEGKSNDQPSGFLNSFSFMRALCVRGSGAPFGRH